MKVAKKLEIVLGTVAKNGNGCEKIVHFFDHCSVKSF